MIKKTVRTTRIEEDLAQLAKFTSTEEGVTRLPFTKESQQAITYIIKRMKRLGLMVHIDAIGNVFGRLVCKNHNSKTIIIGSHYDTVINGGKYDGTLGIIVGLEVVQGFIDSDYEPTHDLVVVAMNGEEGVRFSNGFFGSRAMLGQVTQKELCDFKDEQNISIKKAMEVAGYNPQKVEEASIDCNAISGYIEVHIEQGPVLDKSQIDIGIVEGIVGMRRYIFTVSGEANHAGTTPMEMRKDAVNGASQIIAIIRDAAMSQEEKTVATVGYMSVKPNAINIVPSEVTFSIDIRSLSVTCMDDVFHKIITKSIEVATELGITYTYKEKLFVKSVKLDQEIGSIFEKVCQEKKLSYMRLTSGAGHDALTFAPYVKTAMLFVPSIGGISHHPDEYTETDAIIKAIEVTQEAIKQLEQRRS